MVRWTQGADVPEPVHPPEARRRLVPDYDEGWCEDQERGQGSVRPRPQQPLGWQQYDSDDGMTRERPPSLDGLRLEDGFRAPPPSNPLR
jgi:hypothetical protein